MKFQVLHPANGCLNYDQQLDTEFKVVAEVECKNLNEAFYLSQNDFNPYYAARRKRSTSMGDIFYSVDEKKYYMVMFMGFKEVYLTKPHEEVTPCDKESKNILEYVNTLKKFKPMVSLKVRNLALQQAEKSLN